MISKIIIFIIITFFNFNSIYSKQPQYQNENAITFVPRAGRLGDQLVGYCNTKWLSYKYKIPFLFNPFIPKHSEVTDQFMQLNLLFWSRKSRQKS